MKQDSYRPELAPRTDNRVIRDGTGMSFVFVNPAAGKDNYRDMLVALLGESGMTRSRLASRMGKTRAGINKCFTEGRNVSVHTVESLLWHMGFVVSGITVRQRTEKDKVPASLEEAVSVEREETEDNG